MVVGDYGSVILDGDGRLWECDFREDDIIGVILYLSCDLIDIFLSVYSIDMLFHQVDLLLSYVQTDVRKSVKVLALTDLRLLAKKGPHMWQASHIEVSKDILMILSLNPESYAFTAESHHYGHPCSVPNCIPQCK